MSDRAKIHLSKLENELINNTEWILTKQAIINKVTQQQRWDVNALANLVNNLQDQVSSMAKKMN